MHQLEGEHGHADQFDLALWGENRPHSALAQWLVYAPTFSPFWQHYVLGLLHFRPVEGLPEPYKCYPEAEYEVMIVALDSAYNPSVDDLRSIRHLRPINYMIHISGATDGAMIKALAKVAQYCADGKIFMEPQGISGATEHFMRVLQGEVLFASLPVPLTNLRMKSAESDLSGFELRLVNG